MPPVIIQDSDGDASDESPVKVRSPSASAELESANEPSSVDAMTIESNQTHDDFAAPTVSPITPSVRSNSFLNSIGSPTMSKVKRRQTTMDLVGGHKRKVQKMYGSKTTLDDLGLNRSAISGEWSRNEEDDEIDLVPEKKRKRRRKDTEDDSSTKATDTTEDNLLSLAHSSGSHGAYRVTSQVEPASVQASGSVDLSQMVESALEGLEAIPSADGTNGEMVAQDSELRGTIRANDEHENAPREDNAIILTDPRPDISMQSQGDELIQSGQPSEHSTVSQGRSKEAGEVAPESAHTSQRPDLEADASTSSMQNPFRGKSGLFESEPQKKARKRTLDSSQPDELGSDERDIGLPKENYKPRPSRSRRGEISDEFIASIDFSARPEKVAKRKSKLKRNKTTNDLPTPVFDDDVEEDDLVAPGRSSATKRAAKASNEKTTNESMEEERGLDEVEKISAPQKEKEAEPKKRKRGRPRKDEKKENDNVVPTAELPDGKEATIHLGEEPASGPVPKKRGRKKKVPEKPAISEEKVVDEEDDEEDGTNRTEAHQPLIADDESDIEPGIPKRGRKKSKVQVHLDSDDEETPLSPNPQPTASALRDKTTSSNAKGTLEPTQGSGSKAKAAVSGEKDTPSTVAAKPPSVPAQTPEKPTDSKKPDRHSPLSSGRVPYRVGLSRRARIEPLLRIVKK